MSNQITSIHSCGHQVRTAAPGDSNTITVPSPCPACMAASLKELRGALKGARASLVARDVGRVAETKKPCRKKDWAGDVKKT